MIRVLHFIPAFSMGGVESLIMSLYRNIDKREVQFDFLVETQESLEEFDEIKELGGNVYHLNKLDKKDIFSYIKQIKSFFEKHALEFDVVHCHHIERATVVLYYAKKFNIDFRIIHAHTDSIEDVRFEKIRKLFIRINNRLSTNWFACSNAAGKFQFEKDKKTFIVLKNAIDTQHFSFFSKKRVELRKSMGLENKFVIGHTGRFTYQKNHWKIIDIFNEVYQKNSNARLLLIGDGPLREEMEGKVNDLGLKKVVIFTGVRSDIADLLQCIDVFLLPSFYEGFCISLLEAQSVGLACVASNVIPKEVQVTELIRKLDLTDNDKKWADTILSYQDYNRESHDEIIIQKGYDIQQNAKWLMKFYLNTQR